MDRKLNGWRRTSRLSEEELAWLRQFEGCDYAAANAGRYADTLRVAGEYVRPGSAVVDLGPYPGHLALLLRRRHRVAVTGISFAHTATFVARMAREGITVVEGDLAVADPQLPPASFDIALCTEIIEHLDRPLPLLVRANRLLRKGGILVLSTPNHAALKCRLNLLAGRPANARLFGTRQAYQMNEWVHRREYTAGELARLLEPVGFAVGVVRYSWLDHAPAGVRGMLAAVAKGLLRPVSSLAGGIILGARKTAPAAYTRRAPDVLCALVQSLRRRWSEAGRGGHETPGGSREHRHLDVAGRRRSPVRLHPTRRAPARRHGRASRTRLPARPPCRATLLPASGSPWRWRRRCPQGRGSTPLNSTS